MTDELGKHIEYYAATVALQGTAAPSDAKQSEAGGAAGSVPEKRVQSLLSVGEECISEEELRQLLQRKPNFVLYDGFEPSGRMHIAQGIFKAINVNKCTAAGGTFKFWVADWFALMNDKMGGDLEMIKDVGKYLIEVWKSSGMRMENVKFIWCEQFLAELAAKYWTIMLDISRCSNLTRIKKCGMIMGRNQDGDLSSAQILYPIMQCTDIFALEADICQLGVDQRKVNMLARDYCETLKKKVKPIILSHHMLYGLAQGQAKMSKSNVDSAVFMEDTAADVERKIMNAYCPKTPGEYDVKLSKEHVIVCDTSKMPPVVTETSGFPEEDKEKDIKPEIKPGDFLLAVDDKPVGEIVGDLKAMLQKRPLTVSVKSADWKPKKQAAGDDDAMRLVKDDLENPILDYMKYIVLGADDSTPVQIDGKEYKSEVEIREAFLSGGFMKKGLISKVQIKKAVIARVNQMLQASRKHFTENAEAKRLLELVESHKKAVKENKVSVPKSIRCLKSIGAFNDCSVAVVFAPRPPKIPALSIDAVLSCWVSLNQAAQKADKVALWCEDWSAFCLDSCSNPKVEDALKLLETWYGLLVECLKLVAADLMSQKVVVLYQSQEILRSPNAYWISAIDVGRTFKLDKVRESLADGVTLTESSQVVTTLMHVADMLALSAAAGIQSLYVMPLMPTGAADATVQFLSANAHKCAAEYISEVIGPKAKTCGEKVVVPQILEPGMSFTDVKFDVMIGEGEPAINGKIKKLYCLAGDIDNCPCIDILEKLDATGELRKANPNGEFLVIKGSEKSGHLEDRCFQEAKALRDEFAKGEVALHPGDLKASAGALIKSLLGPIFQCKTPEFTKAHKSLADAAKKVSKKK